METNSAITPGTACAESSRSNGERANRLPNLARNRWSRPDLARVMNTELDYAPYITSLNPKPRPANNS